MASELHRKAKEMWIATAVAPNAKNVAYYDDQERSLRQLLPHIGRPARILDIGCGEGRFTFVLGETGANVLGIDLSPALIQDANATAERLGITHVVFSVLDAETGLPSGPFDVIACMGVFSTIIDDDAYHALIQQIVARLRPDGFLITKDTTINGADGVVKDTKKSVRNYRATDSYERAIAGAGCHLEKKIDLLTSGDYVNSLLLWKRVH